MHKVWQGRVALQEIETDGPSGHWEGMTLFVYNPSAGQSMNFVNGTSPESALPGPGVTRPA